MTVTRREAISMAGLSALVAGFTSGTAKASVHSVGPDDRLVFCIEQCEEEVVFDKEGFVAELEKAGIDPNKCVVVFGMSCKVVPAQLLKESK